jgi:hypothetical protein
MSAFIVSEYHIDFLITAAIRLEVLRDDDFKAASEVGQQLVNENYASCNYRYSGEYGTPEQYTFTPSKLQTMRPTPAVAVLKAIDCLDYQSCEHKGWETSDAKEFLAQLQGAAISALPGYEEAAWEVWP